MISKKVGILLSFSVATIIVVFVGTAIHTRELSWEVIPTPSSENCQFYQELERSVKCGPQGENEYLLSYGNKYCELFLKKRQRWINPLRAWAINTSQCLQESIVDNRSRIKTCYELKEYAFDLHPICYKSAGFCSKLTVGDQLDVIFAVLDASVLSELRRSATQGFNVLLSCMASGPIEILALSDLINDDFDSGEITSRDLSGLYDVEVLSSEEKLIYAKKALATYLFQKDSEVAMQAAQSFAEDYLKKKAPFFDQGLNEGLGKNAKIKCYFDGGGPGCRANASSVESPTTKMFQNYSSENKRSKLKEILKIKKDLESKHFAVII